MRLPLSLILLVSAVCSAAPRFEITFPSSLRSTAADGRLIVVISKNAGREPRFQIGLSPDTQQIFGIDIDGWNPGNKVTIDGSAIGHPLRSLRELPAGAYHVQAVLNVYETFHRSDGFTVKMPMDNGEGQHWNTSPGNLLSEPKEVQIGTDSVVAISVDKVIPPIPAPKDTKYIRHVRIQSEMLTKFWGRPMHVGAIVLVPEGFDENSALRYPIAFNQGHFPADFFGFRETPPTPEMTGIERERAQSAYSFYQDWTSGRLPKMLIVLTQHATPFYDDSYGVNTANMGPYGDALTRELYPYVEKQFRAIGEPWSRVLFGGSTGGWMTIAQQIFYPDYFGGAWGFCPDPLDFHAFQLINVYKDNNAHFDIGSFSRTPRPLGRMRDDHTLITIGEATQQELVLGTKGRSGGQMDAFHATFGPVGPEGYPAKLWDPVSGDIDPEVAKYWEDHYDVTAYLARDWERLGPKLVGKIHITMGTKDTYYLDAATQRMEAFLESTKLPHKGPYYRGSVQYGNNEPHCYTAVPPGRNVQSYYLPIFADYLRKMAPRGADTNSWR